MLGRCNSLGLGGLGDNDCLVNSLVNIVALEFDLHLVLAVLILIVFALE